MSSAGSVSVRTAHARKYTVNKLTSPMIGRQLPKVCVSSYCDFDYVSCISYCKVANLLVNYCDTNLSFPSSPDNLPLVSFC